MSELDEPVTVVDHRAEWRSEAGAEAARIARALGLAASDVEHIGSTAVAGLAAKPTIDLMVGAVDYLAPALQSALVALGYESLGEADVPGRSYFRLRGSLSFNVHLVLKGGRHWQNNLALRQYLRGSPAARRRYTEAKQVALSSGSKTLVAYSAAKAAAVAALLQEALVADRGR
jgi:GrpB-like predicted nucleotidyltransferase (UPF0157 family)